MAAPRLATSLSRHRAIEVHRGTLPEGARPARTVVHDHAGLALFLDGETAMHLGGDYVLTRGDVLLVPEGVPHHGVHTTGATLLGLSLCTACLVESGQPWGRVLVAGFDEVRRGVPPVRRPTPDSFAALERTVEALECELSADRPESDLAVHGLMSLVAVAVRRASPVRGALEAPACSPLVATALAMIEAHALEPISLRDVADRVGRAPGHLATRVKEETGRTVGEWITHTRMAVARQLLLRSDQTVETIAARTGYASPSHFHRTFRKLHGASPDAWRTHHLGVGSRRPTDASVAAPENAQDLA